MGLMPSFFELDCVFASYAETPLEGRQRSSPVCRPSCAIESRSQRRRGCLRTSQDPQRSLFYIRLGTDGGPSLPTTFFFSRLVVKECSGEV